jgi:AcrR family transcriptional regulator
MPRIYQQRARAATGRRTRDRILDATAEYFQENGIGSVNISAIAARAGVQRLTVYRHFPDDDSLLDGCLARWRSAHPWPADTWSALGDPRQRLRVALDALYLYYASAEPVLRLVGSARGTHAMAAAWLAPIDRVLEQLRDGLSEGWGLTGRPRLWMGALIAHALGVSTWRSLVREAGLTPQDAARLMARSAADLARDPYA